MQAAMPLRNPQVKNQQNFHQCATFLNFGRHLQLPASKFDQIVPNPDLTIKNPKFWQDRNWRLGTYNVSVKRFLFKSSNKQAKGYNKNQQEPEFAVRYLAKIILKIGKDY